jgi:hypothetical protein
MPERWHRVGAVVPTLVLSGCSLVDGLSCSTEVQRQAASPGHLYVATTFHRECGATSGFNTQVSIRRTSEAFDPKEGQVLAIAGRHVLSVVWATDKHLQIALPPDRVYNEQTQWEGVKIEYTRRP